MAGCRFRQADCSPRLCASPDGDSPAAGSGSGGQQRSRRLDGRGRRRRVCQPAPSSARAWPCRLPSVAAASPCCMRTMAPATSLKRRRRWPEAMQVLAAHASVCLAQITAVRTTQAMQQMPAPGAREPWPRQPREPKRTAARGVTRGCWSRRSSCTTKPAVRTGREKRDLLHRLAPEIERARRLYEERVSPSIGARAHLLPAGTRAHARRRRFGAAGRIRMIAARRHVLRAPSFSWCCSCASERARSRRNSRRPRIRRCRATASDLWLVPSETAATARAAALYQPLADAAGEIRGRQLRQRADAGQPPGARRQRAGRLRGVLQGPRPASARPRCRLRATRSSALEDRKPHGLSRGRGIAWRG